jgi:ACS family hexuronate transporter-like MFS transporter
MAFIVIGVLGYVWMALWIWAYDKPRKNKHVNQAELNYIEQDNDLADVQNREDQKEEAAIPFFKCLTYKQTWSFIVGKFMTDGVWWFFLFWAPAYFSDQYGYTSDSAMGIALIFTLYAIVTVLSIGGGYLPKIFVEKLGMNPYLGRMRAMLIFACFPVLGLLAQPLGAYSAWWPAILIGLLGAGHQAWSANLFSTVGDMFPKSTIGTLVGLGTAVGGLGSMAINFGSGVFFTWAEGQGGAFSVMGFEGKPAAYMVVFSFCAVAYLIGWCIMKALVPKYKPVVAED